MATMGEKKIKRLRIKQENFELELERDGLHAERTAEERVPETFYVQPRQLEEQILRSKMHDIPPSTHRLGEQKPEPAQKAAGTFVTSPMVGTFYSSPAPDEPVFVKIGDKITKDRVVCIVEAMKVMNEVKAGVEGIVAEVLVDNGHPVEFGTKLFKIT